MNGVDAKPEGAALASVTARAAAVWFLEQKALPRHGTVRAFEDGFRRTLDSLIPRVQELAGAVLTDEVPAKVALAALAEARQRLDAREAPGLRGEVERVKKIAESVLAVSDHHDTLTGLRACLLCDKPIQPGEDWEPFEGGRVPAEDSQPGRVHVSCARDRRQA
ncbi:DUF6415 family natural product biosynthesis protein [Streptomyces sp. Amel2xE9]|uniref:DUF6415 family natural product biosynthesis protein n=1 Tax=unclassified Streptomyces TaxID=2593676 RepID=UPI000366AA93|nr:DUF6415 family natural product biosynthesis protein [Streptomyces sp. Amel2xE9]